MRSLIVFIVLCLSFVSCKKEKMVHITATNVATGERLAGLHYFVVELSTTANGEKSKTVQEGDLDVNGEANFALKIRDRAHVIRVVEPVNYCYRENISITRGPDDDFNADFKFAPCGFLQIKVKNVNCFDANDKIVFDFTPINIPTYDNISPQTKFGCYDNEFIDSSVPSGGWIAEWQVTKNGITTSFDSTFLINEGQHYYFLLEY